MISSITWTDDDGTDTLTNGKPSVGTRFADWVVRKKPIGPAKTGLGTARIHRFEFRTDKIASFSIVGIPESEMEKIVRLEYHLRTGGEVTLAGDRELASEFTTAVIAPTTKPQLEQSDSALREYTLSLSLIPA
jgi:hypothetical protein